MPNINLSILNQKATPSFYADILANRPAPSFVGRVFISTDTYDLYRDTGSAWVLLSPSSTGTITGGGSLYRVGIWTSTSNLGESNDLIFDYSQGHLGINTNTPGTALDVHHDQPTIAILNQTVATNDTRLGFQNNGVGLWRIGNFYNSGANDFAVYDVVNSLERFSVKNTGQTFIGPQTTSSGKLVVNQTASDQGIVVLGTTAPSIRVRNAGISPTQQFGLGLSTGVNNFIQGSASGDFCIFNGSSTASPILFGVYDAGVLSNQEAARISAARNFLVGTAVDSGEKLIVNGTAKFTGSYVSFNNNGYIRCDSANWLQLQSGTNGTRIRSSDNAVDFLSISDSSGAATFSNIIKAYCPTTTNQSGLIVQATAAGGAGSQPGVLFNNNSSVGKYSLYLDVTSNTLNFGDTGGTIYQTLTSAGRVGIGTSSPNATLDIGSGDIYIRSGVIATNTIDSYNTSLTLKANGSTAIFIPSTQNVLIGTTIDTGNKLLVVGQTQSTRVSYVGPQSITSYSFGPGTSTTINLVTIFPELSSLTIGNVWGISGTATNYLGGTGECVMFTITRNSGGGWSTGTIGLSSPTASAILTSVTGSGDTITLNFSGSAYTIVTLQAQAR